MNIKKNAFTMVEIMITLLIIGVIATMALPVLIENFKVSIHKNLYRKNLSILNQSIRINSAKYNYNFASAISCTNNYKNDSPDDVPSICAIFNKNLKSSNVLAYDKLYLKGVQFYAIQYSGATKDTFLKIYKTNLFHYIILDNSIFSFRDGFKSRSSCTLEGTTIEKQLKNTNFQAYCIGWIDVNGLKGPNREVRCADEKSHTVDINSECIVPNKLKYVGDIFPVMLIDDTIIPASAAARYVLNNK